MADDAGGPRTPRQTPFVASAPIFQAIANDWAKRLATEADALRPHMPHRATSCDALAMRMRALALEFGAMHLEDPGDEHRRAVRARWIEAQAAARELQLPGGEYP